MTIPTDRRKLLLGKIIYIGYMILFSNVIVFAGATLGGFLLTTHVPVGGALIAVLFLTVSELWEDVYKRQYISFHDFDIA